MKSFILIILFLMVVSDKALAKSQYQKGTRSQVTASKMASKKASKSASNKKHKNVTKKGSQEAREGQLGTSFAFDTASVRGKYQMAGQGIASVEDEKVLDDLLGLRRSFKDRDQQEQKRW